VQILRRIYKVSGLQDSIEIVRFEALIDSLFTYSFLFAGTSIGLCVIFSSCLATPQPSSTLWPTLKNTSWRQKQLSRSRTMCYCSGRRILFPDNSHVPGRRLVFPDDVLLFRATCLVPQQQRMFPDDV
jgi:hypothetical protein